MVQDILANHNDHSNLFADLFLLHGSISFILIVHFIFICRTYGIMNRLCVAMNPVFKSCHNEPK